MAFIQPHAHPESFFGGLCLDLGVTNAMALPIGSSIMGALPRASSDSFRLQYGILTGITPVEEGTPPATSCDAPLNKAGMVKLCTMGVNHGSYSMESQTVDIKKMGMRFDGCEVAPVRLVGNPFAMPESGGDMGGLVPPTGIPDMSGPDINLSNPAVKMRLELWSSFIIRWLPTFYTGDGTAIDARDRNVFGWEGLINTGYQDLSVPSAPVPCPGADSYILDWGTDGPDGDICDNPLAIYRMLLDMYLTLKDRAASHRLMMPMWAIAMPRTLFTTLTYLLPCEMATFKCGGSGVTPNPAVNINVNQVGMQEEMQRGSFLWLDGDRVPVRQDDFIPIASDGMTPPTYTSDIYFFNVQIATSSGLVSPTFVSYFNFNTTLGLGAPGVNQLIANAEDYMIVDGGRGLILKNPMNHGCRSIELIVCPAPVVLTPQISGRITGVDYSAIQERVIWDPNDPAYTNGGRVEQVATILPNPTA